MSDAPTFDRDAVIQVLESERGRDISPIVRAAARWAVEVTEGDGIWWCERHQCCWGYAPFCGWLQACPKSRRLLIEWEADVDAPTEREAK